MGEEFWRCGTAFDKAGQCVHRSVYGTETGVVGVHVFEVDEVGDPCFGAFDEIEGGQREKWSKEGDPD